MGIKAILSGAMRGALAGARGASLAESKAKTWAQTYEVILNGEYASNGVWDSYSISEMERIARDSSIVFACLHKITSAFVEARVQVGMDTTDGWEPIEGDSIAALLENPSQQFSALQYQTLVLSALYLTGESYSIQVRGRGEDTVQLTPVPTSWVQPIANNSGIITSYSVHWGEGKTLTVLPVDMVRLYWPDPADPTKALGPLQAALRSYQQDDERESFITELLENMHMPGLVVHQSEPWTDEQMRAVRDKVRDVVGPGKRGGPMFTWGADASVKLLTPPNDIDLPGLSTMTETRICACFGVPPQVLGLRSGEVGKTYANYAEANRAFYQQTMVPLWRLIGELQTKDLIIDEGDTSGREVRYDYSKVQALQDDQQALSARVLAEWQGGLRTRGEARAALGLDPLPPEKSDVLALPMNIIEQPSDASDLDMEEDLPDDGPGAADAS